VLLASAAEIKRSQLRKAGLRVRFSCTRPAPSPHDSSPAGRPPPRATPGSPSPGRAPCRSSPRRRAWQRSESASA
jgi:hypothetical protein